MVGGALFSYWRRFLFLFLVLFAGLVIYQIVKKLAGGSWEVEIVILTIVSINAAATFSLFAQISRLETAMIREIYKLKEDIHKIDSKVDRIESKSRH